MAERPPYDVVPEWSPERKEAFALYRDFGTNRSLRAVAERLGKTAELIERWSRGDDWVRRVAAWDAECDRRQQEAMIAERERIGKMHAQALDSTITVLMQAPVTMAERITRGDLKVDDDNDPYSLIRATEAAAKVLPALINASRLVHGFSTANVDVNGSHRVKIENATVEELDALLVIDDGSAAVLERVDDGT